MVTRRQASAGILSAAVLASTSAIAAEEITTVQLPPPAGRGRQTTHSGAEVAAIHTRIR